MDTVKLTSQNTPITDQVNTPKPQASGRKDYRQELAKLIRANGELDTLYKSIGYSRHYHTEILLKLALVHGEVTKIANPDLASEGDVSKIKKLLAEIKSHIISRHNPLPLESKKKAQETLDEFESLLNKGNRQINQEDFNRMNEDVSAAL